MSPLLGPPPPLTASISASAEFAHTGTVIWFSAVVEGGVTPYQERRWSLGDGTVEYGLGVSHAYSEPGRYSVVFVVRDATGDQTMSNVLEVWTIAPGAVLGAALGASKTQPAVGEMITLIAAAWDGWPPYTFMIHAGDGRSFNGQAVDLAYGVEGRYSPSVECWDTGKGVVTAIGPLITVLPGGVDPLVATLDVWPLFVPDDAQVNFIATVRGGVLPYQVVIDFADGNTFEGMRATHVYGQAGTFMPSVEVTDAGGRYVINFGPRVKVYHTTAHPVVEYVGVYPLRVEKDTSVSFVAVVSGGILPYSGRWLFGDGRSEDGLTAEHEYRFYGAYRPIFDLLDAARHHLVVEAPWVVVCRGCFSGEEMTCARLVKLFPTAADKPKVIAVIASLPISPLDKKWCLWSWGAEVGAFIIQEDYRAVGAPRPQETPPKRRRTM